jgi:hypothetical protein
MSRIPVSFAMAGPIPSPFERRHLRRRLAIRCFLLVPFPRILPVPLGLQHANGSLQALDPISSDENTS